jgi:hypothetical protein
MRVAGNREVQNYDDDFRLSHKVKWCELPVTADGNHWDDYLQLEKYLNPRISTLRGIKID